jgi:hypothetical protein
MNAEEHYWPMKHMRVHEVSGLPTLIRALIIIFVIVRKVQLSVYFSYLLICTAY